MFRRTLLVLAACCARPADGRARPRAPWRSSTTTPPIAARGAGDMRAVIRGSDGALWTRSWNGSSWTGWTSLGGVADLRARDQRPPRRDLRRRGPRHRRRLPPQGLHAGRRLDGLGAAGRRLPVRAGRELPPGHGPDRRRRRRHRPPAVLQVLRAGQRLVRPGWRSAARLGGPPEHHLAAARSSSRSTLRGTDGQLYEKYWTPVHELERVPPARRRPLLRRRRHDLGRQPARHLRPRHRRRALDPLLDEHRRLVAVGAPRRPAGLGPGRHGRRPEPPASSSSATASA